MLFAPIVMERAPLVIDFAECRDDSVPLVGGKCASLGELINAGVRVPPGFALTTEGYRLFLSEAGLDREIELAFKGINCQDLEAVDRVSASIRAAIEAQPFPELLEDLVAESYRKLSLRCGLPAAPVAVRSSATAEDLPGASFAGQQETFLWIRGANEVLDHMRRCMSSLYASRAIVYRANRGFGDEKVAISVGVQKMANSYTAGVMFTLHPTNGDRSVLVIDSNYGLGESVVSGEVTPDQFVVSKVTLDIIERTISRKDICYTVDLRNQVCYAAEVPLERRHMQSLTDDEITALAWMGKKIEKHYGRPMDIEWSVDKDLPDGSNIFILQARPETVWSSKSEDTGRPAEKAGSAMDFIVSGLLTGRKVT